MDDRISNCGIDGKVIIKRRNENWRSLLVTFESLRSQFYLILNNYLMAKKIHWKYILFVLKQTTSKKEYFWLNIWFVLAVWWWPSWQKLQFLFLVFSGFHFLKQKVENLPTWTWLFPMATFAMAKVGNQEVEILSDVQLLVALVVAPFHS